MEKLTNIDFALGPGGWVNTKWRRGGRESSAYIRFEPRKRGLWGMAELQVKSPTATGLAEIPLHRIETAFNLLDIREELRERLDEDVSAKLDAAFKHHFRRQPRRKLKRPTARKLDDNFFLDVAFAYREAAVRGLDPVQTIAEDAGVPHSTAARWVAQAREKGRGYLPPAARGKVSG
jgi:hypothetical protein